MRQSQLLAPTLREAPSDAEAASHRWLLRAGYIRQLAAGVYTYLPLARRVLLNLERIVREEMEQVGAQELLLPALQPAELWKESGRYERYGEELIRLEDRHGREFALGPTHEEVITALAREEITSYRRLPVTLYQIQTKFRDERRPRFGPLRGREFLMKDAYSFDEDWQGLDRSYRAMLNAYKSILGRCRLDYRVVEAEAGAIGGEGETHEFMVLADIGEDRVVVCNTCGYAANIEKAFAVNEDFRNGEDGDACPHCGEGVIQLLPGIEVGHIFKLGTKYSKTFNAAFLDRQGQRQPIIMGCYGIGVSRLLSAIAEQHHDERGLVWPTSVAPYQVHILPVSVKDTRQVQLAEQLYVKLLKGGVEVLLDDRDERPGSKFNDADLIGIPYRIVIGKGADEGLVEWQERDTSAGELVSLQEAVDRVLQLLHR